MNNKQSIHTSDNARGASGGASFGPSNDPSVGTYNGSYVNAGPEISVSKASKIITDQSVTQNQYSKGISLPHLIESSNDVN